MNTLLVGGQTIADAAGLNLSDLPNHVYRTGAAVDPVAPFLVIRWEPTILTAPLGLYGFTLRAHDRGESYDRVDAMLEAAKALLTAVVHQQGITQIDWRGRSPDLVDDGYRTLTRYDTYVAAAGLATREEV